MAIDHPMGWLLTAMVVVVASPLCLAVATTALGACTMAGAMLMHSRHDSMIRYDLAFWWREVMATAQVRWWAAWSWLPRAPVPIREHVTVLLHGASANGSCMTAIARGLIQRGRTVVCPNHGFLLLGLARHARNAARSFDAAIAQSPTVRFHVVAHSMGGLVLRTLLQHRPDLAARIDAVMTIATPHAGTALANRWPIGVIRELSTQSVAIPLLPPLPPLPSRSLTVGARRDQIVWPVATTAIAGTPQCIAPDHLGHVGVLIDDWVVRTVCSFIDDSDAPVVS